MDIVQKKMTFQKRKTKIIVGICSHYSGKERREAIRETWLSRACEYDDIVCKFFIGGGRVPEDDQGDVVVLDSNDSYGYLPKKCFDFYRWTFENLEFDHLFKCDDDTYLALDRLLGVLDPEYDLVGDPSTVQPNRMAPSGGAGYLLSRELVSKMMQVNIPFTGCEDLIFGELALRLGAKCKGDDRLCLHSGKIPLKDNDMISCHWCSVENMYFFNDAYQSTPELILEADHAHWKDDLYVYKNGRARKNKGGDVALIENHGKGMLSINWRSWEKELVREIDPNVYQGRNITLKNTSHAELDMMIPPTEAYYQSAPRAAVCISSYKRFDQLERQIFSMLNQDYGDRHIFVAVKGVSLHLFHTMILPVFKQFIDKGDLTIRHFANKMPISNLIDTIRGVDVSGYDLFFNIADGDFYAPSYIKECVQFHQTMPKTWSSCYNDKARNLCLRDGFPCMVNDSHYSMHSSSMVFSKIAMEKIMECEKTPEAMQSILYKWGRRSERRDRDFSGHYLYQYIMKEFGYESRDVYIKENKLDFHIFANKLSPSVIEREGRVTGDLKEGKNQTTNQTPNDRERVLDMRHSYWNTSVRILNNRGQRLDNHEEFDVLAFKDDAIVVKWDGYGRERFVKDSNGLYVYTKDNPADCSCKNNRQ